MLLTGGGFGIEPSAEFLSLSVGKAGTRAIVQALAGPVAARGIHIATVTVARLVEAGSSETSAVAEQFWRLHSQPRAEWTTDVVYR